MPSVRPHVTERPRGSREHRKGVTRRDLLAAGRRLFGEQGLYESRIEDLSRQAGIAKGTLYGYFSSKQELIEAVVSSGLTELLGHAHREAQGGRTHAEVVARIAEAHVTFFEENPDLLRIFHQVRGLLKYSSEDSKLRRILARYLDGLAHILAFRRPVRKSSARANLETATLLFGAVSGISSTRTSLAGSASRRPTSKATVRALVALVLGFEDRLGEAVVASATATGRRSRHES